MKNSKLTKSILALVAITALTVPGMVFAQTFSLEELERRRVERRAVDAAIWGMPTINFDAMRQAYLRDGEAKYGDIIWWPEGSSWRNQSLTGNTTARYLYAFLNTKESGPVVLDLPAAAEAHAWFRAKLPTFTSDWWSGSQWKIPGAPIVPQTGFKFAVDNYFDVDSRGIGFYSFFSPPAKLGGGSFYLGANFDSSGQPFRGENTYRLHVPPNVPVSQFWALTVYDSETAALILNNDDHTFDSLSKGLQKNADGSVDIYLGPKELAGQESNWIHTPPGKGWFAWFRFYGPEEPLFDKSWTMPDIEKVK